MEKLFINMAAPVGKLGLISPPTYAFAGLSLSVHSSNGLPQSEQYKMVIRLFLITIDSCT